jgi:hypothetical protein
MPPQRQREAQRIQLFQPVNEPWTNGDVEGLLYPTPRDFPPSPYWRVICAAITVVDSEHGIACDVVVEPRDEGELIRRIVSWTTDYPLVVTCNGRHFDAPVIEASAMRHRISWPWRWQHKGRFEWPSSETTFGVKVPYDPAKNERLKTVPGCAWDAAAKAWRFPVAQRGTVGVLLEKHWDPGQAEMLPAVGPTLPKSGHVDVMNELSDLGAADRASLDAWSDVCGLPPKPMHGTDVEALVDTTDGIARLCGYCSGDTLRTAAVGLRLFEARGFVSADVVDRLTAEIRERLKREDARAAGAVPAREVWP